MKKETFWNKSEFFFMFKTSFVVYLCHIHIFICLQEKLFLLCAYIMFLFLFLYIKNTFSYVFMSHPYFCIFILRTLFVYLCYVQISVSKKSSWNIYQNHFIKTFCILSFLLSITCILASNLQGQFLPILFFFSSEIFVLKITNMIVAYLNNSWKDVNASSPNVRHC